MLDIIYGYLILSYLLSINKKLNHEIFNFGPDHKKNHKVKEVIKLMKKNWQRLIGIIKKQNKRIHLLNLDSRKANLILGWKPI